MKGIAHPIVPYAVEGAIDEMSEALPVISEHGTGLDIFIDMRAIDAASAQRVSRMLENVVAELKSHT